MRLHGHILPAFLGAILLVSTVSATATESVEALIKRQSQEFSDASASGDAKVIEKYLDDHVAFMDESGNLSAKKDIVASAVPSPNGVSNHLVQTDFGVEMHGDSVAVTTFTDVSTFAFHGQTMHAKYRSTEVWFKQGADWKMISSQTLAMQDDPPATKLPTKALDEYAGTYQASSDFVYKIVRNGDELSGTINDGKPFVIQAELRDVFFTPGQPRTRRIFQRDANGKLTGFVSRREGHDIVLKRVG